MEGCPPSVHVNLYRGPDYDNYFSLAESRKSAFRVCNYARKRILRVSRKKSVAHLRRGIDCITKGTPYDGKVDIGIVWYRPNNGAEGLRKVVVRTLTYTIGRKQASISCVSVGCEAVCIICVNTYDCPE